MLILSFQYLKKKKLLWWNNRFYRMCKKLLKFQISYLLKNKDDKSKAQFTELSLILETFQQQKKTENN